MMKGQNILFSKQSDEWRSPDHIVKTYAPNIYHDVCATKENAQCESFWTKEDDGLTQDWDEKAKQSRARILRSGYSQPEFITFWMNPPHSNIFDWIDKAYNSCLESKYDLRVVALLPARTDTRWFHNYIYGKGVKTYFIKGRLKFSENKNSAPFPSMVIYFGEYQ